MGNIDRIGTFIGTVLESTLGQSSGGNPQWVARLLATKRYIADPEEMKHFNLTEPAYVDWNYDESIVAFMVLFTDKGPLKNYEQLTAATGWKGEDFQELADGSLVGKSILFRVEENNYKDKTTLQVGWIDAPDAPPERTLKSVDASKVAELNKLFLANLKKPAAPAKPAVAAKPATPAVKPTVPAPKPTTPAVTPTPAAAPAPSTPTTVVAAPAPATEAPKTKTPPPRKQKTPPPPPAAEPVANGLPEETTKDAAWDYVNTPAVKGENDDGVIEDAWIAACNEVGPQRDEATFTGVEWARVRNIIMKDLGVTQ